MASIHADRESVPARILVQRLSALDPKDPDARTGRDILRDWDCRIDRSSVAAAVYGTARARLFREVVEAAFGELAEEGAAYAASIYADAVRSAARGDNAGLAVGRSWEAAIESALAHAVRELRSRLGADSRNWTWGAVHRTRPRHPLSRVFPDCAGLLDPPALATHGDADTPLAGAYALTDRFTATAMSVNRYIHDPSDWRNSRWIVPLGASGHPGSPHYADQAELWADVETIPQLWDWNDIVAAAETRQMLMP